MIPRLADDPAWARYEWELRHLPIVVFRQEMRELNRAVGEALTPALEKAARAFAAAGRALR